MKVNHIFKAKSQHYVWLFALQVGHSANWRLAQRQTAATFSYRWGIRKQLGSVQGSALLAKWPLSQPARNSLLKSL